MIHDPLLVGQTCDRNEPQLDGNSRILRPPVRHRRRPPEPGQCRRGARLKGGILITTVALEGNYMEELRRRLEEAEETLRAIRRSADG